MAAAVALGALRRSGEFKEAGVRPVGCEASGAEAVGAGAGAVAGGMVSTAGDPGVNEQTSTREEPKAAPPVVPHGFASFDERAQVIFGAFEIEQPVEVDVPGAPCRALAKDIH